MHFPLIDQVCLPCFFAQVVPGQLHSDGRRYLPLIILQLPSVVADPPAVGVTPPDLRVGVVDRHHQIDQRQVGQSGRARLLLLLSTLRVQSPPYRQGLLPEPGLAPGRASTVPTAFGRVLAVPTWEVESEPLPHERLYAELLLDIGGGTVGVRTSMTADRLAVVIGKNRLEPGDWIEVQRPRVDILGFDVRAA